MQCPNCETALQREVYEDVQVMQCPKCHGYLIEQRRLRLIEMSRERTQELLSLESTSQAADDTLQQLRCPKCKVQRMSKQKIRMDDGSHFFIDVCPECDSVWFDGGELAKLQLDFEASAQAVEAFAFEQRARERTPEEERALDEQINRIPLSNTGLPQFFLFVILGLFLLVTTVVTLIGYQNHFGTVTAAACLTVLLSYYALFQMKDDNFHARAAAVAIFLLLLVIYTILVFSGVLSFEETRTSAPSLPLTQFPA